MVTSNRVLTVPNVLSAIRLATVPVFLYLFVTGREEAAVILYGAGAWTDFFDGYIARRLGPGNPSSAGSSTPSPTGSSSWRSQSLWWRWAHCPGG